MALGASSGSPVDQAGSSVVDASQPRSDLGHENVDGQLVVEERRRLEDDTCGAHDACEREQQQE